MLREDRDRVLHMLDACEIVQRFVSGRSREDLDSDEMLLFALIRAIEVIGEAAGRVSDQTKAAMAEVPWRQISGMRNRLIHGYFEVDRDIVWRTASDDVIKLMNVLRRHRQIHEGDT